MWMLLPALSLAIVHIAGDNAGLVPDTASRQGGAVWLVIILAYFLLGTALNGTVAWIGASVGQEMGVAVRRQFGCRGKKLLSLVILGVSVPASALTGGYYAGWLLSSLTGLPQPVAVLCCLLTFTVLAAGYGEELLIMSNWCSLLLVPVLLAMLPLAGGGADVWEVGAPDWLLVLALFGYNAGGMRPALVSEAATRLRKKPERAVSLAVAAKMVEGLLTLVMAYIVLATGTDGPLALAQAANRLFGDAGGWLFAFVLLCTFANAMVPAMMVNARQLASCGGLAYWPAFAAAASAVYLTTFLPFEAILLILAAAGPATAIFVGYTAYCLHKSGGKQQ